MHTIAQSRQETLSYNSIQFWSGDNPVKASDCGDGQVRVVQQTEEGHFRSCAAVGVEKEEVVLVAGLLLGVGALGISLRRSQRDANCRPK